MTPRVGPLSDWAATPAPEVIEESIPALLAKNASTYSDRPALYWPDGDGLAHVTYGELQQRATAVAHALAGAASRGDRVAAWSRNSVEYVIAEYASAMAGMIFVPFNTGWSDAEAEDGAALTSPRILFAGTGYTGDSLMSRAAAAAPDATVVDLATIDEWAAEQAPADLPTVSADEPFLIQFTSGTTGRSKGSVLSHHAALNGALQRNRHDVDFGVWINPVPYFHIGGSCFVILGALIDGGAFVVLDRWDPATVLRLLRLGVITRIGGVPTMLFDILAKLGDDARDVGLQSVSLGGATVTQQLVDDVQKLLAIPVLISYGQSECPLIASTHISDDQSLIGGTIGRPLPATSIRIVDPGTGDPVPIGTPGELVVDCPYRMDGYWDMPEQTADTVTADGYLKTGDLAEMDASGFITFRGRVRDVIIRGGENVYPAEVEEILVTHPGVAGAVLVGVDDPRLGETVAGVVVRAPESDVTSEELTEFLTDQVARFKIPVAWRFVEALPMTASGKIRKFVVRDETNAELGAGRKS